MVVNESDCKTDETAEYVYKTTDIDVAAVLMTTDRIIAAEKIVVKGQKKTEFTFGGENLRENVLSYINNQMVVNARDLLNRYREVKAIARNGLPGRQEQN